MANRPLLRKMFWQAIDKYAHDLKNEFKRNGTIEGKALGTKDEARIALSVVDNQIKAISKKASAPVKESKNGSKGAKKAKSKPKEKKAKSSAGAFTSIPDPD